MNFHRATSTVKHLASHQLTIKESPLDFKEWLEIKGEDDMVGERMI
jgi:hypothetical protein